MNDNEEKIYDLITSKIFGELSKDEQAFVMDNLGSKEAYAKMREANLAAMEAMADDEEVPADLKSSVMEAFDQKSQKKRGIVWWKYAAAVAVLAVGAFVFWPAGNPEKVQLAENVEREKPKVEAEIQNETEEKESAPLTDSDAETETPDSRDQSVSSETEQRTIEDKVIVEEIADEEEMTDELEMARDEELVADLDVTEMDEEESKNYTSMSHEVQTEDEISQANSLAADAAPPEEPAMEQSFIANQGRDQSAATMTESMTAKRSLNEMSIASGGISLSQIGGPFPKAYVAY